MERNIKQSQVEMLCFMKYSRVTGFGSGGDEKVMEMERKEKSKGTRESFYFHHHHPTWEITLVMSHFIYI